MANDGLLVIDKPPGLTSRAAVDRVLRWFPRGTRIGHTGTLDPLATGVLVLCLGSATRLTEYVQRMEKTYRAGVRLGARSDTDDEEGTVSAVEVSTPPEQAAIERELQAFIGEIDQVPPAFSAAKVTGQRAYALARRGQEVELQPRRVRIVCIDVLAYAYPHLDVEVRCGKGTYMRALARDLGNRLGCGALLSSLRRTRVGHFTAAEAIALDEDAAVARSRLLPLDHAVAELPRTTLASPDVSRLRHGQAVSTTLAAWPALHKGQELAVFDEDGRFAAVVRADPATQSVQPVKVFQ